MMNIMIVTNSRYLKTTAVMLYSLFMQEAGPVNVYLPYEDIQPQELADLQKYVSSFPQKKLIPLYVGTQFKEMVQSRNGIMVETYYRIIGWGMLPDDVERILYLDVDLVIQKSLQGLYNTDLGDHVFAVCEDIFGKINGFHEGNKRRLGIPTEGNYFNAGVMLVNVKALRAGNEVEKILANVYQNYEHYEYNDQDVLNEMYQDRLVYVGWDQYNCPPAWYYLNQKKAAAGILEFASYDEIRNLQNDPQKFQDDYTNLTEQIAKGAAIIHHLADTKPWNDNRKAGSVYEYFDQCYYQNEPDALGRYQKVTGKKPGIPSTPFLFYYGVTYCYNILNHILKQLEQALKEKGYRVIAYDEQAEDINGLVRFAGKRFLAVVGVQTYLFSVFLKESNLFLHDVIYGPKLNLILDHPLWLKNQLAQVPDNSFVLTHDVHYQDFVEAYFPMVSGSMLFPPAFCNMHSGDELPPFNARQYDVSFIGTYGDYRKKIKQILECQKDVRHLAAHFLQKMRIRTELTAEAAFQEVLVERKIRCSKEEFLELFFRMKPVMQCIMYYYREKVILHLLEAGVFVHIWGSSWKEAVLADHPMLQIHDDVTPKESIEIMKQSKISLNIMAWHKGGFTERMANIMEQGSILFTDHTTYDDGELCDGKNLCMFDLRRLNELSTRINEVLHNEEIWDQMSLASRMYTSTMQSAKRRTDQLIDFLDQIGGYV